MGEYLLLILATALVNNVVLVKFLGLCPFMGVSGKIDSAIGMSLATTFVLTLASVCGWLLDHLVLTPLDLGYLRILTFILVIASVVQFTEMAVRRLSPALYQVLGIFLPLITTNCAILGLALFQTAKEYDLAQSLVYALGAGVGFTLALMLMAGLRERLALARVPNVSQGAALTLMLAGLLSLAFMGFAGLGGSHG